MHKKRNKQDYFDKKLQEFSYIYKEKYEARGFKC